jgi:hypothetical protein
MNPIALWLKVGAISIVVLFARMEVWPLALYLGTAPETSLLCGARVPTV